MRTLYKSHTQIFCDLLPTPGCNLQCEFWEVRSERDSLHFIVLGGNKHCCISFHSQSSASCFAFVTAR